MRYCDLETQFRDHQWGSRKSLIEDTFLKEGHDFIKRSHVIIYKDTIMGEESDVHLYFTPESKMLYKAVVSMINISSYKAMQKVQNILVAKYGLPKPQWFSENGGVFQDWDFDKNLIRTSILLHLDSSYSFGVTYISKRYHDIYKLEELKKRKEEKDGNNREAISRW